MTATHSAHTIPSTVADAVAEASRIRTRAIDRAAYAGDASHYSETDDAADLADVFSHIAGLLGCVGGNGWP